MGESERPHGRSIFHLDNLRFFLPTPEGQGADEFLGLNAGRCLVANGCFDILHPGHLSLFHNVDAIARFYCLRPIIAINSDHSVGMLKGPGRPVVPQKARAELISSLRWPLAVVIFDEPTPIEVMDLLRPPVVVKGAEYRQEDVVRWRDSQVVTVPMEGGWSTTGILGGKHEACSGGRRLDP